MNDKELTLIIESLVQKDSFICNNGGMDGWMILPHDRRMIDEGRLDFFSE